MTCGLSSIFMRRRTAFTCERKEGNTMGEEVPAELLAWLEDLSVEEYVIVKAAILRELKEVQNASIF